MNVLIVDDSLLAEHALKSYFEKLDHNVIGLAKTGEIGKEMYLELKPDLVTVDAVMPGISGQDFIKFINEHDEERGAKTLVFMISGDVISDEEKNALHVHEYILKPVTLSKIDEALQRHLK